MWVFAFFVVLLAVSAVEAQTTTPPEYKAFDTTSPSTYPACVPGQKTASVSDDAETLPDGRVRAHVIVCDGDAPEGSKFTRHQFIVDPADATPAKIAERVRQKIAPAPSLTRGPLDLTPPAGPPVTP